MPEDPEVKEQLNEEAEESTETEEELVEDEGEAEPAASDEEDSSEKLSNEDIAFIKLLKDPRTRRATINALATQEGLVSLSETKKDNVKDINERLKEILGDDLTLLPPNTFRAVQEVVNSVVDGLRNELKALREEQVNAQASYALDKLHDRYPDAKRYESQITTLMQKITPNEGVSMYEYLEMLYLTAKGQLSKTPKEELTKNYVKRVTKNEKDRIPSGSAGEANIKDTSKRVSLDEAISAAVRKIRV